LKISPRLAKIYRRFPAKTLKSKQNNIMFRQSFFDVSERRRFTVGGGIKRKNRIRRLLVAERIEKP
jgi:hypothetical protein